MENTEIKKNYLIDMDGVLVHGKKMIPGADTFIQSLKKKGIKFLERSRDGFKKMAQDKRAELAQKLIVEFSR